MTLGLTGTQSGSTLSDGLGEYLIATLEPGGSYTVTPSKDRLLPASQGINTIDVIALQRHFLTVALIPPGCRLTAADVNGDGAVNTQDVIAVQRFFLGTSTGIGNVGKYQFTPASRTYPTMQIDQLGQNYDTLIIGDVAPPFVDL